MTAAAATAEPPFSPRLATHGRPEAASAAFASAAPTKPTGSPTMSAGSRGGRASSSNSAVGALPTTHTAPAPVSRTARRIAAAVRVMPSLAASCAARGSSSGTVASRRVIPPATMRVSHTTGAPASSASRPARSASSSATSVSAYSRSADAWTTRSVTARVSAGRCDRSTRARRIR